VPEYRVAPKKSQMNGSLFMDEPLKNNDSFILEDSVNYFPDAASVNNSV
jgi:hypothetical protein